MQEKVFLTLEYEKVVSEFARCCVSRATKTLAEKMRPYENFNECVRQLELTKSAFKFLTHYSLNPITNFDDVSEEITKASVQSTLNFSELLRIANFLSASRVCGKSILEIEDDEVFNIKQIAGKISSHKQIEETIKKYIISSEEIADNASSDLADIRKSISKCNSDIRIKLNSYIKSQRNVLQDAIITVRNGRYVVPVRTEYRSNIDGLIHDQSASKSTLFIEPMQVVELNNKLKTYEIDERNEIERILKSYTATIGAVSEDIKRSFDAMVELDFIFARCNYADKSKATFPYLNNDGITVMKKARHPLIDKNKIVPIDIEIGKNFDILIITGPNTGGKTVSLKTLGLLTMMAMSGLYVPCSSESQVSFFEHIFCDIGDSQSIENSLSTFSSHITNIKFITENVNAKSLVLLDEVGGGTDPDEGVALAMSIVKFLREKGAKLLTTTHYGALKEFAFAEKQNRVESASMEFNIDTLEPTYKLKIGVAGNSEALDIAFKLGLDKGIIEYAKTKLNPEKVAFEKVLAQSEKIMRQAIEEKEKTEKINNELNEKLQYVSAKKKELDEKQENLTRIAKIEARRIIAENVYEAEEIVSKLKDISKGNEISGGDIIKASQLKRQLENKLYQIDKENKDDFVEVKTKPFDSKTAKVGDKVFVKSLGQQGTIVSIKTQKKEAYVNFGNIQSNVKFSQLAFAVENNEQRELKVKNVKKDVAIYSKNFNARKVQMEINLLGKTVDEAEVEIEQFLEDAVLNGLTTVKIIHGMGTGKLRAGVHALLKKNSLVESFSLGKYGEGETGVTIVELKK